MQVFYPNVEGLYFGSVSASATETEPGRFSSISLKINCLESDFGAR